MKPSLHVKLTQQLKITPALQQAIRLLQLSSMDLETEIRTILEANPLLEQVEAEEELDANGSFQDIESIAYLYNQFLTKKDSFDADQYLDFMWQKNSETTLRQHLMAQVELAHFSERDKIIITTLIDAISEDGYLMSELSEIQQSLENKVDLAEIETVLFRLQQFDPPGVGARNLAECLSIQLRTLPPATPWLNEAKLLVVHYLEALGRREYQLLQMKLGLSKEALNTIIKILTSLNPKPGSQISSKKCEYIIPDVIAFKKDDKLIVELNREFMPKLRINPDYAALLQDSNLKNSKLFFKEHLKEAKWFLKGLTTRNETLLKVARSIMEQQKDFFDDGEEALKPLNLQDIAKKLNLHESTVSRITTQKYIFTPRGIFELKYFFPQSIHLALGNEASSTKVCALIKKIIAKESSQTPLSDAKISELLAEQGITIARRTVTKYRKAMHILSAINRRKKPNCN